MKRDQQQVKKAAQELGTKIKNESLKEIEDSTAQGDIKKDSVKANFSKSAQKIIQKGMQPKDMIGLSDQMVEGIYGQAYRLYQTGRYDDASQLFRLLIMINSNESKYLLGLAACFHMLKEYKSALETYAICAVIDSMSPVPHYHSSDCYLQKGDKISAVISLELAVQRSEGKPEYQNLKDRAKLTIESLKKEIYQGATPRTPTPNK